MCWAARRRAEDDIARASEMYAERSPQSFDRERRDREDCVLALRPRLAHRLDRVARDQLPLDSAGEHPLQQVRLSVVEIAEQLDHSPSMTLDTYAHVIAEFRGAGSVDPAGETHPHGRLP